MNPDSEKHDPAAKLLIGQKEIEVDSWKQAMPLIEKALSKELVFTLKLNDKDEMSVMTYDHGDFYLGLQTGHRLAAWFSQAYTDRTAVVESFHQFYKNGNLSDEVLSGSPEWREASKGSPLQLVFLVLAGLIIVGLPLYFLLRG